MVQSQRESAFIKLSFTVTLVSPFTAPSLSVSAPPQTYACNVNSRADMKGGVYICAYR